METKTNRLGQWVRRVRFKTFSMAKFGTFCYSKRILTILIETDGVRKYPGDHEDIKEGKALKD